MRFTSIGTLARWRSYLSDSIGGRAGYMLLEALVSLGLVLAFAAALGPYLFHARQIMSDADNRIAAQALLRSLLDRPIDRTTLSNDSRDGDSGGLHWRISTTPIHVYSPGTRGLSNGASATGNNLSSGQTAGGQNAQQQLQNWTAYRLFVSVSWRDGHAVSTETVRLGSEH
jgi:hypothetical protein